MFLGFSLGSSALLLRGPHQSGSLLVAVVVLAVPFTDTVTRQIARWVKGGSPFDISGGTDHLSHRLVRMGMHSYEAAVCHAGFGFIAVGAATWAAHDFTVGPLIFALALFGSIGLGVAWSVRRETLSSVRQVRRAAIGAAHDLGPLFPLTEDS